MSGSGITWAICKSAPRSRQITMPALHYSSFLQAGCPSCRPTNSVKALKAMYGFLNAPKYLLLKFSCLRGILALATLSAYGVKHRCGLAKAWTTTICTNTNKVQYCDMNLFEMFESETRQIRTIVHFAQFLVSDVENRELPHSLCSP